MNRKSLNEALALLEARPPGHIALVACHHPLVGKDEHGDTLRGEKALDALSHAGAHAVLSGHVHDAFDFCWQGVRLIGAGTLSERVRSTRPSFNELTVENGALTVRTREMAA